MKSFRIASIFLILLCTSVAWPNINKSLIIAASKGNMEEVVRLVEKGASFSTPYEGGKTALHWAVLGGNLKIVAFLITKGASVNIRDNNSSTPLQLSGIKRNLDIVKLLVQQGADINHKDKYGWTALHYFTYYEFNLGVKYLLVQGADYTIQSSRKNLDFPEKITPLDIAVKKNQTDNIAALEHPDKYLRLSKKPLLYLSTTNYLSFDNKLMATEHGILSVTIDNKGGGWASNVALLIEKISNCESLSFSNDSQFHIGAGESVRLSIPVSADAAARDGLAAFHLYAQQANYFKEGGITGTIPLLSLQPAQLFINYTQDAKAFMPLNALEKRTIPLVLENRGRGYANSAGIVAEGLKGCELIQFMPLTNLSLKPNDKLALNLELNAFEELKDGKAEFRLIPYDSVKRFPSTNRIILDTRRLLKPSLSSLIAWNTMIQTNTEYLLTTTSVTNETNSVDITVTNTLLTFFTNLLPQVQILNAGEGPAQNVSVSVTLSGLPRAGQMNFQFPIIPTNESKFYRLPVQLPLAQINAGSAIEITAHDGKNYSFFQTNVLILEHYSMTN